MAAALRQQYGLRVNGEEFRDMPWGEFADLVGGLSGETALAYVARNRTTTDRDVLAELTPEQRSDRAEWQRRRAMSRSADETDGMLAVMQQAIANAFGGGVRG